MKLQVLKDVPENMYGTFAYLQEDKTLVVGKKTEFGREDIFVGSVETFVNSTRMQELTKTNPALACLISDYYTKQKFNITIKSIEEYNEEANTMDDIIKRLWKHNKDYQQGKTQDFGQVCKDCLEAADKLYMYKNSEITNLISEGAQKENMGTKLCEIKVTEGAESFKELVFQLTANGYRVDAAPVYKEFPKTSLDYWMIAIFDKE